MMLTRLPGHSCKRAILYMGIARAVSPRASSVQSGQWGVGVGGHLLKQRQSQHSSHATHRLPSSMSGRVPRLCAIERGAAQERTRHLRVEQHVGYGHSAAVVRVSDSSVHTSRHGDGMQKALAD